MRKMIDAKELDGIVVGNDTVIASHTAHEALREELTVVINHVLHPRTGASQGRLPRNPAWTGSRRSFTQIQLRSRYER